MEPLITRPPNSAGEKTLVRDISWCGVHNGANASMVDVKDGKIIRIRPARYYDQYTRDEVKPWVMHARGKTFEPSDKSLAPPLSLAYKKRVFSPGRVRFPMKRVDFDPSGAPGSTGPVAATPRTAASASTSGSAGTRRSTSSRRDDPHQGDLRAHRHPQPVRPARREQVRARSARLHAQAAQAVRGLHPAGPRRRQLGRLVVGFQARVGLRAGGPADAAEEPHLRHLQERRTHPALGLRPRDHGLGLAGPAHQPAELLVDRTGHQADLHRARRQLRQRRARRQVDPRAAQHRRGSLPGHRARVVQERHLRQGLPRDPRLRRGQVRGLRHGPGGRRAQDRRSGPRPSPGCRPASSRPWRPNGPPSAPPSSSATAAPASAARTPPSRPACRCSAWPCRAWASRAATSPR